MYTSPNTTPAIKARIAVEKRIVKLTVKTLLEAGYELAVDTGGDEFDQDYTANVKLLHKALMETDEDVLHVRGPQDGWVRFVYGNDGWDVINDYTTNLEEVLTPVNALVEKLGA